MKKHPFYSCGSSESCGSPSCDDRSDAKNQVLKGARGQSGEKGKQGAAGTPGKGALVVGSMFDNIEVTPIEVDGSDETLISDTLSILKESGLDVDEVITVKPTLDESDLAHIKTKVRFSNGWLNWMAKWLIPRQLIAPGSADKFFMSTGAGIGNWGWRNSGYKCSSSSSVTCGTGIKTFNIGTGYNWSSGVIARAISGANIIEGTVSSYTEGVLSIDSDYFVGTGLHNAWIINIGSRQFSPTRTGDYVITQLPEGYSLPVIMNGCAVVKDGTNYTHTRGQIYYQGNVYQVNEVISPIISVSDPKWGINGDYFVLMPSPDGISQWNQTRRLEHIQFNRKRELYEALTIPKMPSLSFFTDNFNSDGVGYPYKKYEGFEIATGFDKSVDIAGKVMLGINFRNTSEAKVRLKEGDVGASIDNSYYPIGSSWNGIIGVWTGEKEHLLLEAESGLRSHAHALNGFTNTANDTGPGSIGFLQNYPGETPTTTVPGLNASLAHENRQPSVFSIIIQKVAEISE